MDFLIATEDAVSESVLVRLVEGVGRGGGCRS